MRVRLVLVTLAATAFIERARCALTNPVNDKCVFLDFSGNVKMYECYHGKCDTSNGRCVCEAEWQGEACNKATARPTAAQLFAIQKGFWHGVNLGGWLLMEITEKTDQWMFDQIHAKSQLDYVSNLRQARGDPFTIQTMRNHWEGYYPDWTLDKIQEHGISHARIPVTYWVFEAPLSGASAYEYGFSVDGHATGSLNYLEAMLEKLAKRNIKIVIDLHSLPGCSTRCNAFAGALCDEGNWFWQGRPPTITRCNKQGLYTTQRSPNEGTWMDIGNKIILKIANWIVKMNKRNGDVIVGFELINEPALGSHNMLQTIKQFYYNIVPKVDKVFLAAGQDVRTIFNFIWPNEQATGDWIRDRANEGLFKWSSLMVDYHAYYNFDEENDNACYWLEQSCSDRCCGSWRQYTDNKEITFIGEWSLGASKDNQKLSCLGTSADGWKGADFLKAFYANQMSNFFRLNHTSNGNVIGHFYWTLRVGSGWNPEPTAAYPKGHQVAGSAVDKSLVGYPYCHWNFLELERLGAVRPLPELDIDVTQRCACAGCLDKCEDHGPPTGP